MKRVFSIIITIVLCFCFTACGDKVKPTTTPTSTTSSQTSTDDTKKVESNNIVLPVNPSRLVQDEAASVKTPTGKINADLQKRVLNGEIVRLKNDVCLDLNDDGVGEIIRLEIVATGSSMDQIHLTIGNRKIVKCTENVTGDFYAGMLSGKPYRGIQILVYADGPSNDPFSHVFHYEKERIWDIGGAPCHPNDIRITQTGFDGARRGIVLHYFYRNANYTIAFADTLNNSNLEKIFYPPHVVEVPKDLYAMGTIVTLKQELILQSTRFDSIQTFTIPKGTPVSITATDDIEWLYITPYDTVELSCQFSDGAWLKMKAGTYFTCLMNGKEVNSQDLFNGLTYCD